MDRAESTPQDADSASGSLLDRLTQHHDQRAWLGAFGTPTNCRSLHAVAVTLNEISRTVAGELKLDSVSAWASVGSTVLSKVKAVRGRSDAGGRALQAFAFAAASDREFVGAYRCAVYRARTPFAPGRQPDGLDRLLVVALSSAAGKGACLGADFADGLRQAYRSIASGVRDDWRVVADAAPTSAAEVDALIPRVARSVVRRFLEQVRALVSAPIGLPRPGLVESPVVVKAPSNTDAAGARGRTGWTHGRRPAKPDANASPQPSTRAREPSAPSVSIASGNARCAPLGIAMGIEPVWDRLCPHALSHVTHALHNQLMGSDARGSAMALLAIVALIVGFNPKSARLLACVSSLAPEHEVFLLVPRGWICWWNHAATGNATDPHVDSGLAPSHRPLNVIPLPEEVAARIQRDFAAAKCPEQLHGVVDWPLEGRELAMDEVNALLRGLGDPVHLAEPTRFAASIGLAVLHVTGSEMLAAQMLRPELIPGSAENYYAPKTTLLAQQYVDLYRFLGLGRPVSLSEARERQGVGLSHAGLRDGFERLVSEVVRLSEIVQTWPDSEVAVEAIAQLAPRCAWLFAISYGGRGTALERITIGCVTAAPDMFAVLDKDVPGRDSHRLIPHTTITLAVTRIMLAARSRAAERLGIKAGARLLSHQSLFAKVGDDAPSAADAIGRRGWVALDASAIARAAHAYVGAAANLQRAVMLTALAERHVDRWLVRAMSGHGSHLTHAYAPGMGVAPAEAMSLLREQMEAAVQEIFGSAEALSAHAKKLTDPCTPSLPVGATRATARSGSGPVSSDPLPSLDTQCLVDRRLVEQLRRDLAQGPSGWAPDVELLLSMLVISGIPSADAAVTAVMEPASIRRAGRVPGVLWDRPHYAHELWLPLQRPTRLALHRRGPHPRLGEGELIAQTAGALRGLAGYHEWPSDDRAALLRLQQACERWRRIELPPYLCVLSLPSIETACLSHHSVHRLATADAPPNRPLTASRVEHRQPRERARNRVHGLRRLNEALSTAASATEAKGGLVARGKALDEALDRIPDDGTPTYRLLKRVVRREALEMREEHTTANEASSARTRFSALWPTLEALPWNADPEDFDAGDWIAIVENVNAHCLREQPVESSEPTPGRPRRSRWARDALQRLFNVLERTGVEIPAEAWHALGGDVVRGRRMSASSVVLLDADVDHMRSRIRELLAEEPLLAQRLETKLRVMVAAPMRIGEASCLPIDCLTRQDHLVVPDTPFSTDKTEHAQRLIPIDGALAESIRALADVTRTIAPHGRWLYRFDDRAVDDDVLGNALLGELLQEATGEPSARPHALRAHAYQERLWPGWRDVARDFLDGRTTPETCRRWVSRGELGERWARVAASAVFSGHGAVDPGLTHYAAAWGLVYAIHLAATAHALAPGEGWIERVGLKPQSMARARRRATGGFDAWRWLEHGRANDRWVAPLVQCDAPQPSPARPAHAPQPAAILSCQSLTYLVLRALGRTQAGAMHDSRLAGRIQELIEPYKLNHASVRDARRRSRQRTRALPAAMHSSCASAPIQEASELHRPSDQPTCEASLLDPQGERVAGDVAACAEAEMLCQDDGRTMHPLLQWISMLSTDDVTRLAGLFGRDERVIDPLDVVRSRDFWGQVTRSMPSMLRLRLRFGVGERCLRAAEEISIRHDGDPWILGPRHPDRGRLPDVSVQLVDTGNAVVDRRVTALVRLTLLARLALDRAEVDHLKTARASHL